MWGSLRILEHLAPEKTLEKNDFRKRQTLKTIKKHWHVTECIWLNEINCCYTRLQLYVFIALQLISTRRITFALLWLRDWFDHFRRHTIFERTCNKWKVLLKRITDVCNSGHSLRHFWVSSSGSGPQEKHLRKEISFHQETSKDFKEMVLLLTILGM